MTRISEDFGLPLSLDSGGRITLCKGVVPLPLCG